MSENIKAPAPGTELATATIPDTDNRPLRMFVSARHLVWGGLLLALLGVLDAGDGLDMVTGFIPVMPTMKPVTASMLAALALGLLRTQTDVTGLDRLVARTGAGYVIVLSLAYLLQGETLAAQFQFLASPSDATSFTLLLLGLSLWLLQAQQQSSRRVLGPLAITACLIPLHRFITVVVGGDSLQTVGLFGSMSLPSAIALLLLTCGVIFHPCLPYGRQLLTQNLQGRVLRTTLPWVILLPAVSAVLFSLGIELGFYENGFVIVSVVATSSVMMTVVLWRLSHSIQLVDERRSEAKQVLRDSEAYANQLIELAPKAMVVVNEQGLITRVNARLEELFGYRRDELLNQPMELLLPERYRAIHAKVLQRCTVTPRSCSVGKGRDLFVRHKDGREVAIEIALAPLETNRGRKVLASITDISGRLQAQAQIKAALQEKTLLLNEVHHRVKNNLQIVASLLSLQSGMVDDPVFTELMAESEGRVRAMALMHQVLYERKDFSQVELDVYLERLARLFEQIQGSAYRGIQVRLELDPIVMDLTRAIPLGLIVNELLNNAFKHAFPEGQGGKIWLGLKQQSDSEARLTVRDSGRGLPAGLMKSTGDSLGMQIVSLLSEQIGGSLKASEGQGGCIELCFPPLPRK